MTQTPPAVTRKKAYHARLVTLFVQHGAVGDVVKASGLSRSTVTRWKCVAEYWAEVEAARGSALSDTLARLRVALPELVNELLRASRDDKQPGSVRARAAGDALGAFTALSARADVEETRTPQPPQLSTAA